MEQQLSGQSQRPLASSNQGKTDTGSSATLRYLLLGCGALLVLTCVCLAGSLGTFAFLQWRSGTPMGWPLAQDTPVTRVPLNRTPVIQTTPPPGRAQRTPTPAAVTVGQTPVAEVTLAPVHQTPAPAVQSSSGHPQGWRAFDDPSGQVRLAIPPGWNAYYEESRCCNVTLTSFNPGELPGGRINWGPPGSGAEHEVPPGEVVIDLFLVTPPFAEGPIDFFRPPDGEDTVGGRYVAQLYFSAPFTDWPIGQVITYLWQDERRQQWCLIAYFGTPFELDQQHLATLGQILATIQHGSR